MAIDLYEHPISPPCRAVLMTANYIGVEVKRKQVNMMEGEHLKPEFLKMNPQHTIPTMDDNGFYLWESRAIQTYLVDKYSPDHPIYPKDPVKRAVIDRLLYFDIGTLYNAVIDFYRPQLLQGAPPDPEKLESIKKAMRFLEDFLGKSSYAAANHITLADICLSASLSLTEIMDFDFTEYPKVSAWFNKVKREIPSYHEINDEAGQQMKDYCEKKRKSAS